MPSYPLHVPYEGNDPRKRALAGRIENYINSKMEEGDDYIREFDYWVIAEDLGVQKQEVHDLLYPMDAGSNGITIYNPKNKPVNTAP
jgi:hypothetical protein